MTRRSPPSPGDQFGQRKTSSVRSPRFADGVDASTPITVARLVSLQAECYLSRGGFRYWPSHRAIGGLAHTEPIEISAVGFGESLALIGIPAEPFLEISRALRDRSRAAELLVCGYTNGIIGYLPTRAAFPEFGYEVGMARYSPDSADRVIEAAAGLLGKDRM